MKIIFVCSPFQGREENVEKAKRYCRMLVNMGYIPIAPHVYFSQFMDDLNPDDRRKALEMNKKLLEFCDELWIFGDEITEGMKEEIEYFRKIKGDGKIRRLTVPDNHANVASYCENIVDKDYKHEGKPEIVPEVDKS